jgi:predicted MFS family arabinose efflux permease
MHASSAVLAERSPTFIAEREIALRLMSAASFLIFFQAYLVAPLIPALMKQFNASQETIGLLVPAYLLPYGFFTLIYGPLSDRVGRRVVLLVMIGVVSLAIAISGLARSPHELLVCRLIAGISSGGIIPISIALFGDLFPYAERGRPLGWIFGGIAGGMAFGSTCGALLNDVINWRIQFIAIGAAMALVFVLSFRHRKILEGHRSDHPMSVKAVVSGYFFLLAERRGGQAYGYILFNGIFHSGVFSWLGLYLSQRYQLSDRGIGLALLGYGIPGLLLGPMIGKAADRFGRRALIAPGILLAGVIATVLALPIPLAVATVAFALLSFGYDMSHPLLSGIITSLHPTRRGLAMGLSAFMIFTGFGLGSLIFQFLLPYGFARALFIFAGAQIAVGLIGLYLFRNETRHSETHAAPRP